MVTSGSSRFLVFLYQVTRSEREELTVLNLYPVITLERKVITDSWLKQSDYLKCCRVFWIFVDVY